MEGQSRIALHAGLPARPTLGDRYRHPLIARRLASRGRGNVWYMAGRTSTKPIVIVGGGKAGGTAAATLREEGFDGPIVIINREPGIPFGRPPIQDIPAVGRGSRGLVRQARRLV